MKKHYFLIALLLVAVIVLLEVSGILTLSKVVKLLLLLISLCIYFTYLYLFKRNVSN